MASLRCAFPCIATSFAKLVRINLTWTLYSPDNLRIWQTTPLFSTIKDGRAHRACSVEPRFVQPNKKDTQRANLDKKCFAEICKKLDVERMTSRPIYIAYPGGQGSKLTLSCG